MANCKQKVEEPYPLPHSTHDLADEVITVLVTLPPSLPRQFLQHLPLAVSVWAAPGVFTLKLLFAGKMNVDSSMHMWPRTVVWGTILDARARDIHNTE